MTGPKTGGRSHPARSSGIPLFADRNPVASLNSDRALSICGSVVATLIGLASAVDLPTRRVLLLDGRFQTRHVVAEVLVSGHWIYVDPLLGREIAPPTGPKAFIRLARLPLVGSALQSWMLAHYPNFGASPFLSLILDEGRLPIMIFSIFLVVLVLLTPPAIVKIRRHRYQQERKRHQQELLVCARLEFERNAEREISSEFVGRAF